MWIEIAFAAGCLQTGRNAVARSLAGRVSPALNSWSRFAFNLPFSGALVAVLVARFDWPHTSQAFFAYCAATAVTQLLGNVALMEAFERATFAQSIVLHKLEIAFTPLIGLALFGEVPSVLGFAGILVCTLGVLAMNLGRGGGGSAWRRAAYLDAGALLALACGVLLVFASFLLKEATTEFALLNPRVGEGRFEAAAHTLLHVTWIEVALLTVALLLWRPSEFRRVPGHARRMLAIGFLGFAGSICWFWAYSIALVAYVKAVGQVEAVLSVLLGLLVWREREVLRQLPGVALVVLGIVIVLLG